MAQNRTIIELSRSDLARLPAPTLASISEVRHLSSYNWIEASTPTIAVPGCPPAWHNVNYARGIPKDCGHFYIAQNNARLPESPLEPLFRALYESIPDFDIRPVDVVSDRNSIRKLLSFVNLQTNPKPLDNFTIKVEVVGGTALFGREEAIVEETIGPMEFRGYGHSFEQAYTKREIENSTGHHRIISYRLGNLSVIIRHKTHAYLKAGNSPSETGSELTNDGAGSVADMISSLALYNSQKPVEKKQPAGSTLTIRKEGRLVRRESTMEIKSRIWHKPIQIDEVVAQLWISQTPKLVRAHHDRAIFPVPVVEDVAGEIREWERSQYAHLKKLASLIRQIGDVAKGCRNRKAVVRYDASRDVLVIQTSGEADMLPRDLYRKWEIGPGNRGTEDGSDDTSSGDDTKAPDNKAPKSPSHGSEDDSEEDEDQHKANEALTPPKPPIHATPHWKQPAQRPAPSPNPAIQARREEKGKEKEDACTQATSTKQGSPDKSDPFVITNGKDGSKLAELLNASKQTMTDKARAQFRLARANRREKLLKAHPPKQKVRRDSAEDGEGSIL